jgi:hypothetical protein
MKQNNESTDRKVTISSRLYCPNVWTAKRLNIARSLHLEALGLRVGLLGHLGLKEFGKGIEELQILTCMLGPDITLIL